MKNKIISIGWDVGGWMGNNHGFAVCTGNPVDGKLTWVGSPVELAIPHGSTFSLEEVISTVGGEGSIDLSEDRVAIGVDAPLGFPVGFTDFLAGDRGGFTRPEKEIYNGLAYRETDKYIYENFDKKPLSAVFDRLGTNCTAALVHVRKWSGKFGFVVQPRRTKEKRNIYEVYPALVKDGRHTPARPELRRLLPGDVTPGTDAYDAALCPLMGLGAETDGEIHGVPELVGPPAIDEVVEGEGWIYHFPPG
ncbi:MAG: DUF429 domain-containing protein [Candidatus Bipolaricaulota bacterium]